MTKWELWKTATSCRDTLYFYDGNDVTDLGLEGMPREVMKVDRLLERLNSAEGLEVEFPGYDVFVPVLKRHTVELLGGKGHLEALISDHSGLSFCEDAEDPEAFLTLWSRDDLSFEISISIRTNEESFRYYREEMVICKRDRVDSVFGKMLSLFLQILDQRRKN